MAARQRKSVFILVKTAILTWVQRDGVTYSASVFLCCVGHAGTLASGRSYPCVQVRVASLCYAYRCFLTLHGSFLRVQPFIDNQKLWSRLLKPGYINECISLFKKYAVRCVKLHKSSLSISLMLRRTMKASVKDELTIPKQSRFLVPIQLGRVERHVRT